MPSKAFTLIELMIAIAIIGILVGIAYPSYTEQVQKTRRSDGKTALLYLAANLEHYYTENQTYTGISEPSDLGASNTSPDGFYSLSFSDLSDSTYTVKATPSGAQANDSCGELTLTHTGAKSPASCW